MNPIFHISEFPYPISKENLKYKIDNIFNEKNKIIILVIIVVMMEV